MVNKITNPITPSEEADKINEVIDELGNIATDISSKATDSDVVHKTGNETITGEKTFTNMIISKNPAMDTTILPENHLYQEMRFTDKNNISMGSVALDYYPNGTRGMYLQVRKDDLNIYQSVNVYLDANNNSWATAPASDVNGSIVTTANKSKTENGYFKLGNGLIIQWGRATSKTWNFPIPFSSNTSFSLVFNNNAGTDGYGRADTTASLTSTSVTAQGLCETPIRWLAIGY